MIDAANLTVEPLITGQEPAAPSGRACGVRLTHTPSGAQAQSTSGASLAENYRLALAQLADDVDDENRGVHACAPPGDDDVVALLVKERVARRIERAVLTPSGASLSAPVRFAASDPPTYIVQLPAQREPC